jgi:Domain of unknown function (DUF5666)
MEVGFVMRRFPMMKFPTYGVITGLVAAAVLFGASADVAAKNGRRKKSEAVRGLISEMTDSSVKVNDRNIQLTDQTEFEDFVGGSTSLDAFKVGDCVKIKLFRRVSPDTAKEMELEESCPTRRRPTPAATRTKSPTDDNGRRRRGGSGSGDNDDDDDDDKPRATPSVTPTVTTAPSASATPCQKDKSDDRDDDTDDSDRDDDHRRNKR